MVKITSCINYTCTVISILQRFPSSLFCHNSQACMRPGQHRCDSHKRIKIYSWLKVRFYLVYQLVYHPVSLSTASHAKVSVPKVKLTKTNLSIFQHNFQIRITDKTVLSQDNPWIQLTQCLERTREHVLIFVRCIIYTANSNTTHPESYKTPTVIISWHH